MSSKTRVRLSILLLFTLLLGWYFLERNVREQHAFGGIPSTTSYAVTHWQRIFRNEGFMLGYSEWRKNPLWVTYKLRQNADAKRVKRPKHFAIDNRSLVRVSHHDYRRSGFDRGHLAPNYAMGINYGAKAQYDSFLMTNISPQRAKLNQKLWQRIEEQAVDHFATHLGDLWVITGPLFGPKRQYLPSGVEIPAAFYKIFVHQQANGTLTSLSFKVPQTVNGTESLKQFVVSIDEIEAMAKLDFFHALSADIETRLEEKADVAPLWRLDEIADLPPRY